MPSGPRDLRDLHAALRRFYQLPQRLQLEFFDIAHEYLELGVGVETRVSRELQARRDALAAMVRAAEHLRLADNEAPIGTQYDAAADALGLMPRHEIITAYQRWRNAQRALTGGWVPETPAQRALRRATSG